MASNESKFISVVALLILAGCQLYPKMDPAQPDFAMLPPGVFTDAIVCISHPASSALSWEDCLNSKIEGWPVQKVKDEAERAGGICSHSQPFKVMSCVISHRWLVYYPTAPWCFRMDGSKHNGQPCSDSYTVRYDFVSESGKIVHVSLKFLRGRTRAPASEQTN